MKSYAQLNTDVEILSLFPADFVGRYVDVGASHPEYMSNTYLLYEQGWRGIAIEPTSKADLWSAKRKEDVVYNCCAGQYDGTVTFHVCHEDTLSSINRSQVEKLLEKSNLPFVVQELEIKTIATILNEQGNPKIDLLSIDTEGHELEVLEGCPFESPDFRPIVVIEACEPCTFKSSVGSWEHILVAYDYKMVKKCGVNNIYMYGENQS